MEYKSLFIGIAFSIGIFALKSGIGLYYLLSRGKSRYSAVATLAAFLGGYGIVFWSTFLFLKRINLLDHLDTARSFLSSGMWLHFGMALLMTIWGVALLKSRPGGKSGLAWIAMIVPCPVCFSVIFFSISFALAALPEAGHRPIFGLYGLFIAVSLAAAAGMKKVETRLATPPEPLLGATMVAIAAYFLLSVTALPHVSEADEIYRLANRAPGPNALSGSTILAGWGIFAAIFGTGFVLMRRRIRRVIT